MLLAELNQIIESQIENDGQIIKRAITANERLVKCGCLLSERTRFYKLAAAINTKDYIYLSNELYDLPIILSKVFTYMNQERKK
jgi:hypothetical protein